MNRTRMIPRDGSAPVDLKSVQRKTGGSGSNLKFVLKICHKWTNMKLKQRAKERGELEAFEPIPDPEEMLEAYKTGVILAQILEQLEPGLRVKVRANPRHNVMMKDNLLICFKAIDKIGIPHKGIAADDFLTGQKKYVGTFLWNLVERYDYPKSAKLIIKWFNKRIKPFGYKVDLLDAAKGCVDGVPFCALIESQKSQIGTYDVASLPRDNPISNMNSAFEHLATQFEVDPLLEPEDVANGDCDDMQLVVYLKQVKAAFDAEIVDIEPESCEYPDSPFTFCPGEDLGDGFMPVVLPGDVENLDWVVEPDLPEGLELDELTGALVGCPTPEGCCDVTEFTVTAENSSGSVECKIQIMVREIEPTGIAFEADNVECVVGEEIQPVTPHVEPVDTKVSFSVAPELPAGLVFDTATGTISGAATEAGSTLEPSVSSHNVTAMNSGGAVNTDIAVTVKYAAPADLEAWNEVMTVGEAASIPAPGEQASPVVWHCDNIPEGCAFDSETGVLSGTPVAPMDECTVTLSATNSGGSTSSACTLKIIDAPPTEVNYESQVSAVAEVGIKEGGDAPAVTPATPVSFSVEPALPSGLVFDEATGAISGVPDASAVGATEHTVTAKNTGGEASTQLTVTVLEVPPSELSYADGTNQLNFVMQGDNSAPASFQGTGSFSVEPALPEGLALQEDGTIAGCPVDQALFNTSSVHVVTVANSGGECTAEVTVAFSDSKREFFEYVDAHQSDFIQDLSKCVAIPSETGNEEALSSVMDWLEDYATNRLHTKMDLLGQGLVGITLGNDDAKKTLCVYGHLDINSPSSPELYKLSVGDLLTGAGVAGAKGPLVAWLSCAEAYVALGKEFPVNLKFLVENCAVSNSGMLTEALKGNLAGAFIENVDMFCVSETNWLSNKPCLTYSARGFLHLTGTVTMPVQGAVNSAVSGTAHEAMSDAAALMATAAGLSPEATLDTAADFQDIQEISFELDEAAMGYKSSCSDKVQHLNNLWSTASVSILGMNSGPSQPAAHISAHTLPQQVSFELAVRTFYGQDNASVEKHVVDSLTAAFGQRNSSNSFEHSVNCSVEPFSTVPSDDNYAAAAGAINEMYGVAPDYVREGATVAAASTLQRVSGKSVCLIPIGSAQSFGTDNMDANNFKQGIKVAGLYMENIAGGV